MKSNHKVSLIGLLVSALLLPQGASADEGDAAARIKQLEQMTQQLQAQRAEQDKQIELLTKELVGVENQISQSKIVKSEEKGKSQGSPVYGAFKDGLVFDDGTGKWKLQINGRIQADYKSYEPDEWRNDTFSIRRARFGGTFSFLKDFAVRVEGEYANDNTGARGTTALTYGYLDYTRWAAAKIRVGQFKPFFGLERPQSTNFTDFTELSLATSNGAIFNSTYDRGIMVFGDPLTWLNYNAYVVNGTGQNNDDVRDSKDVGGRINANFAALGDIKNAVIHVGASASDGSIGFSTSTGNSIAQSTESNGNQFFSVANISSTTAGTTTTASRFTSDRSRLGLETALAYGPLKFQAEYIKANFEGRRGPVTVTAFDNDIKAWYADLNWMVTGEAYSEAYKSGVFGRIKPKNNFDDKDGWGAFELGLRYSKFDASDFKSILPAATATTAFTSEADSLTAGAKWILNPNARILLNYIRTRFDNDIRINSKLDDIEKAVVVRAQYDF
ncbi:MAG TPA: porin [Methylophilaceae bacterium]|nr:porin [Methylophilaceae bacterium]